MQTLTTNITLPTIPKDDLEALAEVCRLKAEKFPAFCVWVLQQIQDEFERREDPSREPSMASLPKWNSHQLSDALLASYVFCRWPFTDEIHRFLDDVGLKITCEAAGVIAHFQMTNQ